MKIWDVRKWGNRTALIEDSGSAITYDEIQHGISEFTELSDKTEGKKLVFCLCSNTIGSVYGYVSIVEAGMVPLLISSQMDKELLDRLIESYQPEFIWAPEKQFSEFGWSQDRIVCSFGYALIRTDYKTDTFINKNLALLLTTSGSTGSPKFVRQSYENIKANTESIVRYLELDSSERPITTLPMNYTYGLSIINTHLAVGATILLTDKTLMQKEFWQFFKEKRATSFGGVPYTYEMLDRLKLFKMILPSLRTMTQAGGKLTTELQERFARYAQEAGRKFIVMYGQCEATARMAYLPADKAVEKEGSMGIAIPGGKLKLVDADGREIIQPYKTGELVYEGANVTLGYAECREDLTKDDERNGVLATGDMAQFDEEGYFYIVGRKKRFLKIFGNRVNLDEMERLIKGKFDIDVACTGKDDHLYIFLTDDNTIADEVKKYVVSVTKLNPTAFKTTTIDEIPKNDSGKIQYTELEKYYDI